ncbi:MAG: hypothetical protein EGR71_02900 [Clostridiales bacterium]|nr:hypothetical protein [Clostridiales bacterium]
MAVNNESIGISAEVAIAKSFGVKVNPYYEARAERAIVDLLLKNDNVKRIFDIESIPAPIEHIAEGQNPVDFVLTGNKSLSVKTNQEGLGKVAPQMIGQPTAETYFTYLERYFSDFSLRDELIAEGMGDTYESRSYIFKKNSMNNTAAVVDMYWRNLFDCDYYLHFFNLDNYANPLNNYVLLGKSEPPEWDNSKFSFTQSLSNWNESNTLKYCGISMGEFQVHRNRNCFKFRFNMKGIMDLLRRGLI